MHTISLAKARTEFSKLIENVNKNQEEYIINVNGLPTAVLMSAAKYDSWGKSKKP